MSHPDVRRIHRELCDLGTSSARSNPVGTYATQRVPLISAARPDLRANDPFGNEILENVGVRTVTQVEVVPFFKDALKLPQKGLIWLMPESSEAQDDVHGSETRLENGEIREKGRSQRRASRRAQSSIPP
jgi:hypothetical protein